MTRYVITERALRIARHATGGPVEVRDVGLLDAAVHPPRVSVLGDDADPDLLTKAAALLHSLARNHPLVDGNKRLAGLAMYVFLAKNNVAPDPTDDDAYQLWSPSPRVTSTMSHRSLEAGRLGRVRWGVVGGTRPAGFEPATSRSGGERSIH